MRIAPLLAPAALLAVLAVLATGSPLRAQASQGSGPGSGPQAERPLSEQIDEAIRGLMESVEPALEQLRDTFRVLERIDSLEYYEKPEILPNGDVIIRRKADAPPYQPESEPAPESGPGIRT